MPSNNSKNGQRTMPDTKRALIFFCFISLLWPGRCLAQADLGQTPPVVLEVRVDEKLGFKMKCRPEWAIESDEDNLLMVISEAPKPEVWVLLSRTPAPGETIEKLNPPSLQWMGEYDDGYIVSKISLSGLPAVKVEAQPKNEPSTRILDYYIFQNDFLYRIQFSVSPKEQWENYYSLFTEMMESFRIF